MSQQSEIFSKYRSLYNNNSKSLSESETARRLNNMDCIDFLFELVRSTKGQKDFKNLILKGSLGKFKKADQLNKVIKKSIFGKFGCDDTLIIPTKFTTKSSLFIEIDKNEVDAFGLMGIDPNGKPGIYLYEGNDITKHMNFLFYKAQSVSKDGALIMNYKNNVLFSIYAITPSRYAFQFGEYYENKKYGEWLTDYQNTIDPIFNMVNFTTILTDLITGSISLKANKSKQEIRNQSSVTKAIQKIFGFCSDNQDNNNVSDSPNKILDNSAKQNPNYNGEGLTNSEFGIGDALSKSTVSSNVFNFTKSELLDIEKDTELRSDGKIRFSTCGDLDLTINPDDIIAGLDALFLNANINDVYSYEDALNSPETPNTGGNTNGLYDNSKIVPNIDKSADFFDNTLKNGAINALNSGESNIVIDLPSMNSELQLNILKAIPYALMQMILTPKIIVIPKLHSVLSGDESNKSVNDFIAGMTPIIQEIGAEITSMLIDNIFNTIKADLTKLGKDLATRFLKQRSTDYLSTVKSLTGLLGLITVGVGSSGVLDKLLKLLKMPNSTPMPKLPAPLILVGGALKPGMNSVALMNDLKSNLAEKGVETSATMPDGSPNNIMIAIEETVKVMISHIKTNSTVQTFGIGPTGPVVGSGQIQ